MWRCVFIQREGEGETSRAGWVCSSVVERMSADRKILGSNPGAPSIQLMIFRDGSHVSSLRLHTMSHRPSGPINQASNPEAEDCRFESYQGDFVLSPASSRELSAAGARARVTRTRAEYASQLDHSGYHAAFVARGTARTHRSRRGAHTNFHELI